MNHPEISIIVPVYNTEKYLHRCIDSILTQTFTDFELLLIDDGSKDGSGAICDEYAKKDSRVKVIHKTNTGVSDTRNVGLDKAAGEYVLFVDSDDWIASDTLEVLYSAAVLESADIVSCDFTMIGKDWEKSYETINWNKDKTTSVKRYITYVWTVMWNLLVRKDLYINYNLLYPLNIAYCEDFCLSVKLVFFATKLIHVNKSLYFYNQQNTSSVMHQDKLMLRDELSAYFDVISFFRLHNVYDDYAKQMSWRILKAKQELILDKNMHSEFLKIHPDSHKHIWSCPYINIKLKFMMWGLTHSMSFITDFFLLIRNIKHKVIE